MTTQSSLVSMEISPTPGEVRLKRFLHYGRETPLYLPGDRFYQQCFTLENFTAVEAMLADSPPAKHGDAVNHIVKALMDGYSGYPECLVFALAACACQRTSEKLRNLAYDAVKTVCKTPKDLFLFVQFTTKLAAPHKGYGYGWRRAICNWYLKKEPLELAECVSRFRGNYGWRHRDLIKLAHLKTDSKVRKVILQYVMKGLPAAKQDAPMDDPEVPQVLSYLQCIEDFKHLNDEQTAARLIELHGLSLDHVPAHNSLNKSLEVWMALVQHMPLQTLLENLIRLSCLGFLRPNQPLESQVVDRLSDQSAVVESHLHPTQVYLALRTFEEDAKNKAEMMAKLVKTGKIERELKPAPKPNPKVVAALHKLLLSAMKLLVPTGLRYLVAIDLSPNMLMWRCNNARDVKPAQAAVLLALCLLQAEREVTVVTFPSLPGPPPEEELIDPTNPITHQAGRRGKSKRGAPPYHPKSELRPMNVIKLEKDAGVSENLENLKEVPAGPVEVGQPIVWAQNTKKPVDVFIVLTDYVTSRKREVVDPADALKKYRAEMNLPNSKLITCALVSTDLDVAASSDPGMLDVVGFDGKMARIIEAFCRGAF